MFHHPFYLSLISLLLIFHLPLYHQILNAEGAEFHQKGQASVAVEGAMEAIYSHPGGFYEHPFTLTLSPPENAYAILYTLDGSNPVSSPDAYESTGSAEIYIHPDSDSGRGKTPGFIVRSAVMQDEGSTSFPKTHTYLFIKKVREQRYPGDPWPEAAVNNQVMDYELAEDVLKDPRYSESIELALMDLPSLCIATDNEHLFGQDSGIYVNPEGRGHAWERDASVELFYPGEKAGFQVNAGLRIRGGSSRDKRNPKHSLRLFFRSKYGASKLRYPLFGSEGANVFDKIDLRTAQNYSWNADRLENHRNTLVRDVFSRDLQREIGQPYTRSRYYHLYLNGMYWGIYQTQERAAARYASTYFNDDHENYDVIKVNPERLPYKTKVTDGNDEAWREVYELCREGFKGNADYFHLEGRNADGDPEPGKKILVDIDNLINYLLIIFYTGNFDAPVSAFGDNKMPNNFYAVYNREDNNKGFIFFLHDSEHSLMTDPAYVGEGLYENRVNIGERADRFRMEVNSFEDFHPQWIHQRLSHLPEYRQRFADRAYKVLGPEGLFTPEKARNLFETRVKEIETAIIAESARWGDAQNPVSRTRDDDWIPQLNAIRDTFFPKRTGIVIDQLKEAGLYTQITPPLITIDGEEFHEKNVRLRDAIHVILSNPVDDGVLYYTLDGTDPRSVGGEISEDAVQAAVNEGSSDVEMDLSNSTVLKARIKNGNSWSAIREFSALKEVEDYSYLKITELNYNPLDEITGNDTIDGGDFEFVEFKNTGADAINLTGLRIDSAIQYEFPANEVLPPGAFYVIADKPALFYDRYGMQASGNFSKNLSNSGEYFVLFDAGNNIVFDFTYSDKEPWPEEADGEGYTLVSIGHFPEGTPDSPYYWRKSFSVHGSPFKDDVSENPNAVSSQVDNGFKVYPNPSSGKILIEWERQQDRSDRMQIVVTDLSGSEVFSRDFYGQKEVASINLAHVPEGLYLIWCTSGSVSVSKKVFIKR